MVVPAVAFVPLGAWPKPIVVVPLLGCCALAAAPRLSTDALSVAVPVAPRLPMAS